MPDDANGCRTLLVIVRTKLMQHLRRSLVVACPWDTLFLAYDDALYTQQHVDCVKASSSVPMQEVLVNNAAGVLAPRDDNDAILKARKYEVVGDDDDLHVRWESRHRLSDSSLSVQSHVMEEASGFLFHVDYTEGTLVRGIINIYSATIGALEMNDGELDGYQSPIQDLLQFIQPAAEEALVLQVGRVGNKEKEQIEQGQQIESTPLTCGLWRHLC